MLTPTEKLAFIALALLSLGITFVGFMRIVKIVRRGEGRIDLRHLPRRTLDALVKTLSQRTVLASRPGTSHFHAFVAWGFFYYLLVNFGDALEGFVAGFRFMGSSLVGDLYRLGADLLSVAVLVGMSYLVYRRFIRSSPELQIREDIPLHPGARRGIYLDSAIVAGFILLHAGARFLGQSFRVAREGADPWQPFTSLVARLWTPLGEAPLATAGHVAWWAALGLILAFLPYFPYSKHLHLMAAPVNFLTGPERPSTGALSAMDLDTEAERFGPERIEHLAKPSLIDAFACIMCNRCQDVCPAYAAGTTLSPSALEINKRYEIRGQMDALARGEESHAPLLEGVIPADAVRACTSCAACVEICPVGNEPLQDIMDIRRYLTLTEGDVPPDAAPALRNIERRGDPWGNTPDDRAAWAKGMNVPTMAEKGEAKVLFWVGCSGSFDPRAQKISRSIARLLERAGVDFAILGVEESCTGDPARRMGEEFGFQMAAEQNGEVLSRYRFDRVITGCPHCFNTLKHEYRDFGVELDVVHHTQLIDEMIQTGKLTPGSEVTQAVTYHDSCYLGRYNGEYDAPRAALQNIPGLELREMPRNRNRSFCCGGGGGGAFYEPSAERSIPDLRLEEAAGVDPDVVASACPFCMTMFEGSPRKNEANVEIKDIAELLDEATRDQEDQK